MCAQSTVPATAQRVVCTVIPTELLVAVAPALSVATAVRCPRWCRLVAER